MAERRMFTKTIIDSDAFLDMPLSTHALYFHLSMRADDDGFLNNAMKIQKMINASKNDYDLLIAKKFIIQFDDGICVIKHWRMHNYIQKDRYKETVYKDEKSMLEIKKNGAYKLLDTECIQDAYSLEAQVRLGKDSIELDKDSIEIEKEKKHKFGEFGHVRLKQSESDRFISELGQEIFNKCIKKLDEYMQETGKKYKDHNLTIRRWVISAVKDQGNNSRNKSTEEYAKQLEEWANDRK